MWAGMKNTLCEAHCPSGVTAHGQVEGGRNKECLRQFLLKGLLEKEEPWTLNLGTDFMEGLF